MLWAFEAKAQEPAATEMPPMSKELKKLDKERVKVIKQYNDGKSYDKEMNKALEAYNNVIAKKPDETAAANWFMAETMENIKAWDEHYEWLKKTEESLTPNDRFYGILTHSRLGWSHYLGRGCEINEELTVYHFHKAYEYDPVRGSWDNAHIYLLGINDSQPDFIMALTLFSHATHTTLRWPEVYAIEYYLNGIADNTVTEEAWNNYIQGYLMFCIKSSVNEAIIYLNKSAEAGFLPANKLLGDIYLGSQQVQTAIDVIRPAAEANYPPAVHQLGYYIETTTWGKLGQWKEMEQVASLYLKGAELGFPASQNTAGYMYLNGYGHVIQRNPSEAVRWFETAIISGEPSARVGKNLALQAINEEQYKIICQEIQNLTDNIESIINKYQPSSGSYKPSSGYARTGNTSSSGSVDKSQVTKQTNYYKNCISHGKHWIKSYNEACAAQEAAKATNDWIAVSQAGDRKLNSIKRMQALLREMDQHRTKAELAGGSIPVDETEAAMRQLVK